MEVDSVDEVAARIVDFLEMSKKPEGFFGQAQNASETGGSKFLFPENR